MLKILIRQPLHLWRLLEMRYKLEAFALLILTFAFVGTHLDSVLTQALDSIFPANELTFLVAHIFTFLIAISTIFIISWLLPRQNSLRPFLLKPLNKKHLINLLVFYCSKFLSLYLILLLPTMAALISTLGLALAAGTLLVVIIFTLFFLIYFIQLKQASRSNGLFIYKNNTQIKMNSAG